MVTDDRLSGALQENLLVLLCFDDAHCQQIRAALTPQLFESSIFREVAGHAIDFIDQYKEAIKEHLPDHLEGILKGEDARKAASYQRLVDNLFQSRDSVNGEYVISQLSAFVRQQNLKSAVIKAVECLEDGRIDQAEVEIEKALRSQVVTFAPGLNLSDPKQSISLLDDAEEEGFDLGITEFDRQGIIPRRKELFGFIAPRGRGKSWFCTHAAKWALLQRWSVVVITLEMSEKRYAGRMLQSFFSISKREASVRVAKLVHDRDGGLMDVIHEQIERMTLQDPGAREKMMVRLRREFRRRPPLVIKQFPTRGVDVMGIEAYLDGLERHEGITPDLIIIDYPDLMKHDPKNKRVELGMITEDLRGLMVRRNAAGIVVSQGNRESESATTVTGAMAAEDISKLATYDTCITYSQTAEEAQLGLARLLAEKARNEEDGFSVLITQAYGIGQFCLDSTRLRGDGYWGVLSDRRADERDRGRDEEEEAPRRRRSRSNG